MIRCIFYVEDGSPPCQALQAMQVRVLSQHETGALENRYCLTGAFISCPVLERVQARLAEAHIMLQPDPRSSM